jgi:peptide/nickel transport system substrate-binding protein
LTADDLVFSAQVGQDRELPQFRDPALGQVASVAAPDSRTLVVQWKQPFIEAASLFAATSSAQFLPMPRHLLEAAYADNKAGFADLPYWSDGFVGAGPYQVAAWLFGSSLSLVANGQYVLGRPRVDAIDVRFFGDPNALYAAVLANEIDVPLGHRALSFEQAVSLKEQWQGGVVGFDPAAPLAFWPQLNNPTPAVIGDARFRRALLHAIDRQEMASTLGGGLMPIADTFILPDAPEYSALQTSAVKYGYDPRQATQLIEGLGYTKASDGFFRDPEGSLRVEIRSSLQDNNRRAKLAAADYWQKIGVAVTPVDDPDSRRRDIPYRATFPGFETRGGYGSVDDFKYFHSSEARLPEKGYVGVSVSNYMNPDMDALVERYQVTIPPAERLQVAGQIVRHLTDQVIGLTMFYDAEPTIVGRRTQNIAPAVVNGAANTWNAHEWDVI